MEWKDLDLKTYRKVYEITSNAFTTEEDKRLKVAALLGGITYEQLLEQPLTATTEMVNNIAFLFERPKPIKIKKEYVLNGRAYTPFKDFLEIQTNQYIDYQSIIVENFEEHLIDLMSIILIPKGHTYLDGYDKSQQLEDLETLSVAEALGIADFFISKYRKSLKRILLYSKAELTVAVMKAPKETRKELREKKKELDKNLDELLSMCGSLSLKRLLN